MSCVNELEMNLSSLVHEALEMFGPNMLCCCRAVVHERRFIILLTCIHPQFMLFIVLSSDLKREVNNIDFSN